MQQPSSPSQQHPQQPPEKKHSRRGWWISATICGVILLVYILSRTGSQPASTPTTSGGINTDSTQSTQGVQATPTPVPTIAPISLSGVGQQATNKLQLQQGLTIFKLTHNGTANFIVDLLDSNGQEVDNLVNVIGSFNGSKAEGIPADGIYLFNVQADGNWTLNIT